MQQGTVMVKPSELGVYVLLYLALLGIVPNYLPVVPQSKNLNWSVWFGEKGGEMYFYGIVDDGVGFPGAFVCLKVCESIFNNQTPFSEHCKSGIACVLKNWKVQNMLLKLYIIDNKRHMQTLRLQR